MEILNWVIPLIHFPSHLSSIQNVLMSVYLVILILFRFLLQVIFFASFFQFYLITVSHSDCWIYWSLLDFIFKTFDLSEIHDMLTAYISMCGGFRHVVNKYYYGKSGRGVLPDIFNKYSLNTRPSWPQTLSFECREVRRKRKNGKYSHCPFCVRICFYRELGNCVIKNVIWLMKVTLLMNLLFWLMRLNS